MRLVLLIMDERCNRVVLSDAEHRTAFQPARPQRSQGFYVSTVRLSKCKKLHSIRHSTTRASDWPSRQHADWDKWDKHFGVLFYTVASLLHFRQYAFLRGSACLSLPVCTSTPWIWPREVRMVKGEQTALSLSHVIGQLSLERECRPVIYLARVWYMHLSLAVKKKKSHNNLSLCMSKGCHDIRIQSPPLPISKTRDLSPLE